MHKLLFLSSVVTLAAACGGGQRAGAVGNQGTSKGGDALVFVGWGEQAVFEADCHGADGCAAIRAKAHAGGILTDGNARFRLGATRVEECGASGDTADVVTYDRLDGEDTYLRVAAFPDAAAVDLVIAPPYWGDEPRPAVDAATLAAIATRATADLVGTDRARTIASADLVVTQVVVGNFSGGAADDRLISAEVPVPDDEGPGYVWSGFVIIPDGDLGAAHSLWHSELETLHVNAHYDIDGDGVREFVFSADYYEGSSVGAGRIEGGKLALGRTASCGA